MSRDHLATAADHLAEATEHADGEHVDRIRDLEEQLRAAAEADRGPDQGRLDRQMHALAELAGESDREAADALQAARDHVRAYRETVSGV